MLHVRFLTSISSVVSGFYSFLTVLHSLIMLHKEHEVRVFGPKRDDVTGEWRKLHNENLGDLYSLPSIVRVVK